MDYYADYIGDALRAEEEDDWYYRHERNLDGALRTTNACQCAPKVPVLFWEHCSHGRGYEMIALVPQDVGERVNALIAHGARFEHAESAKVGVVTCILPDGTTKRCEYVRDNKWITHALRDILNWAEGAMI